MTFRFQLFLLMVIGCAGYLVYHNKRFEKVLPAQQQKVRPNFVKPDLIEIKGPSDIVMGTCTKISATFQDGSGLEVKSKGVQIKAMNSVGGAITLFSGNKCGVADLPVLELQVPAGQSQIEFYSMFGTLGKTEFHAYNTENGSPIRVEARRFPLIKSNGVLLKLAFLEFPTTFREMEPFDVKVRVGNINNFPLESLPGGVELAWSKSGSKSESGMVLGKGIVANGIVEFKALVVEECETKEIRLRASVDGVFVVSNPITKGEFKRKNIQVEVEGTKQTFAGKWVAPNSVELLQQIWTMKTVDSKKVVTIKGQDYVVEAGEGNKIRLRKKK